MNISDIANVVDIEHDNGILLEVGLTTISLSRRAILKTCSLALKPEPEYGYWEVSEIIQELTGWTRKKLDKRGFFHAQLLEQLKKHGFARRLLIADTSNEFDIIEEHFQDLVCSPNRLNASLLVDLKHGFKSRNLDEMLELYGLTFEGRKHSGADDSRNIARLFLEATKG